MTPSTPKTFLYLAREAPGGVVLYRRSHLTTFVLKLTGKDGLQKGSRFYGRMFPERCSLSPDGKLFSYFAMRGKKTEGSADPATWAAVCSPPWLKAHIFAPDGSTWGWGGLFLDGRIIAMLDPDAKLLNADAIKPYSMIADPASLPEPRRQQIAQMARRPKAVTVCSPLDPDGRRLPHLVRQRKPHVASGYDMFDYVLHHPDGREVEGAEDIVLANWAGWDCAGRLLAATGRHVRIHHVQPERPLDKPRKVLDIEMALAN